MRTSGRLSRGRSHPILANKRTRGSPRREPGGEDAEGSSQADLGWGVVSGRVAEHGVCGEDRKGAVSGHRERKEVRAGHRQRRVLEGKDVREPSLG